MSRTRSTTGALSAVALAGLVTIGIAPPAYADHQRLSASGSDAEEVPTPDSGEEGVTVAGTFEFDDSDYTLTYTVSVDGSAEETTAGHIHEGEAGVNGDVVIQLDPEAVNNGTSATVEVDEAVAEEILANPEGFYLNVHSESFQPPVGNARAQLSADEDEPDGVPAGSGGQFAGQGDATSTVLVGTGAALASGVALTLVVRRRRAMGEV